MNKFTINEINGDLFTSPDTSSLAHCVSKDLAMGAGIARIFKSKFQRVDELYTQNVQIGGVGVLKDNNRYIYYLVSKDRYWQKPSYNNLKKTLINMKEHCINNKVKNLCIPRIGCGLDRLKWVNVKEIIEDVFKDISINITVYYL